MIYGHPFVHFIRVVSQVDYTRCPSELQSWNFKITNFKRLQRKVLNKITQELKSTKKKVGNLCKEESINSR